MLIMVCKIHSRCFLTWRLCVNELKLYLERTLSSKSVSPLAVLLVIILLIGVMLSFYTIPAKFNLVKIALIQTTQFKAGIFTTKLGTIIYFGQLIFISKTYE